MKTRKKTKDIASNLFEAIKTADAVKDNPKKYKIAKKLVAISENKFIKERQRLKENHGHEDETEMAKAQLEAIIDKAKELHGMLEGMTQLEDWVQYKLSISENYIDAIHGYIKYFNGGEEMDKEEMYDNEEWDDIEEEEDFDEDEDFEDFDEDEDFEDFDDFEDDEFEEDDDDMI